MSKRTPPPAKPKRTAKTEDSAPAEPAAARNGRDKDPAEHPENRVAHEMASRQRDISVSEFFTKNRHLLGFDSPRKALLTTVKEAVDNSLDACEEAGILPDITVKIQVAPTSDGSEPPPISQATRFIVTVEDNGPGIVRKQISKIFAKLLYGSKFHRLRMSRGQQGIGISAAGMYGQLTTGKPTKVFSRTGAKDPAHYLEIVLDTKKNEPIVLVDKVVEWEHARGTSVSIELEGRYVRGKQSIDEYLEQTSIANPHVQLTYVTPEGQSIQYPRGVGELPRPPKEIKPHPHGIELGMLLKMLQDSSSRWVSGFLSTDFSRVSAQTATAICKQAGVDPHASPRKVVGHPAETLYKTIQATKLMAPPTDCLSPIGEQAILAGLHKQIRADFYTAVTRSPAVYRGNPFVIEAGLAFGSGQHAQGKEQQAEILPAEPKAEGEDDDKQVELARLIRFANRVPLLYQQSACAVTKAALDVNWRGYGLSQSRGTLPQGPMVIFVHMASVWVPFTSESKEAIAEYEEIEKEVKLAIQECGRRLGAYIRKRENAQQEFRRRNIFALYIPEVVAAVKKLKGARVDSDILANRLQKLATKLTGGEKIDEILGKKRKKEEDEVAALPSTIIVDGTVPSPTPVPELPQSPQPQGAPAQPVPAEPAAAPAPVPAASGKPSTPDKKKGK